MRYFLNPGIILRKQNSGENDYYLTIFTPQFGRLQAISRGSRKITSQKGSHLDNLNFCQFQFYKNGDRYLITECRVENSFSTLKNDLNKSLAGLEASEIVLKSLQENEENQPYFDLLLNFLTQLNKEDSPALLLEEFKIKTLKTAGSWPEMSLCHFCQNKWQEDQTIFTDQIGQLTCQNCLKYNNNKLVQLDFPTVKLANFLATHQLPPQKIQVKPEQLFNLQKITTILLNNYLQQELKTEKINLSLLKS